MGRSPTDTREKLIQTANELIWLSSYGSVSVDDICKTSGVNKGSFYYYFPSKAELAVAAMEVSYQSFEIELNDVFSTDMPPVKRFENLAAFIYKKQKQAYRKYGRVCGCPFASLGSEMAGNETTIQKKADEIFDRQRNIFMPTLQEMINSGQLPVMIARIQNNLTGLKKDIKLGLFQTLDINEQSHD